MAEGRGIRGGSGVDELARAFGLALGLLVSGDRELYGIVALSLEVSLAATLIACLLGMPAGMALALFRFPGRRMLVVATSALMGLPPVVVGLFVYLLLSRAGPLGALGLLYTPAAMVIAQTVLVTPIVTALTRELGESLLAEYGDFLAAMGRRGLRAIPTLLHEGRHALVTVALAGFGRAIAEVGAVMMVGGNIRHVTRVMTTAIALETGKGEIALALALGLVLLTVALAVNALAHLTRLREAELAHARA